MIKHIGLLFALLALTNEVRSQIKLTKVGTVTDLQDALDIIKTVLKNNDNIEPNDNDDGLRTFNSAEWNYDFGDINNAQVQLKIKPIDERDPNKKQFRYRPRFRPSKPNINSNKMTTRRMTIKPYATVTQNFVKNVLSIISG
ncbi:uncharacterized protein LOC111361496 [Spodoptera litura]|uniref:Uncharacterized protein LOC111361496 n=1 Tax=Spodoptera litura TaxID=69820 RepID=A0A9J7ERY9_SPOLT|nr:uncharacterized protein LOC111361496 [Spodoptera litura]